MLFRHPFDEQKLKKMSRFTASQKIRGTDGQLPWRPNLGNFAIDDLIQKYIRSTKALDKKVSDAGYRNLVIDSLSP